MARVWRDVALLVASALLGSSPGCLPDNPTGPGADGGEGGGGQGPLGCVEDGCTLVAVSQTLDDRVDLFAVDGNTPSYRGSIDFDLKDNPGGDITGMNLDEPLGLVVDARGLHLLVGHYPSLAEGSLFSLSTELLAGLEVGAYADLASHWDAATSTPVEGSARITLGLDPIGIVRHPSGRLLVSLFANDKFAAESGWTEPGELAVVDPDSGGVARVPIAGCAGAWNLTALDDEGSRVAAACEGDEGVAILDVSAVGQGSVADAAASIQGCSGDVLFTSVQVRHVAGDGEGGALVTESPSIASFEDTRLWWFDADCGMRGLGTLAGPDYPRLVALRELPGFDGGPHWLLAVAGGGERGIHVLDGSGGEPTPCARLEGLDGIWGDLEPRALDVSADGRALVVTTAPEAVGNASPAAGQVWWVELSGEDACGLVASPLELTTTAPAVDAGVPETWRRGPNVVRIFEALSSSP